MFTNILDRIYEITINIGDKSGKKRENKNIVY